MIFWCNWPKQRHAIIGVYTVAFEIRKKKKKETEKKSEEYKIKSRRCQSQQSQLHTV